MARTSYTPSPAAQAASDYYNALSIEERQKLAPLLEHYRQMGLAEALDYLDQARRNTHTRIIGIRTGDAFRCHSDAFCVLPDGHDGQHSASRDASREKEQR